MQVVETIIEKFFHCSYLFTKIKQLVFFREEDFWYKLFILSCKQFLYTSLYIEKQFQKFQGFNAQNTTFPEYFFHPSLMCPFSCVKLSWCIFGQVQIASKSFSRMF